MDHFPCYVTRVRKFGYYSVNQAWEGNSFNLMYCVNGEIHTVYYSSTCERLTQIIVRIVFFLLAVVALPYDFPRPSYYFNKVYPFFSE